MLCVSFASLVPLVMVNVYRFRSVRFSACPDDWDLLLNVPHCPVAVVNNPTRVLIYECRTVSTYRHDLQLLEDTSERMVFSLCGPRGLDFI